MASQQKPHTMNKSVMGKDIQSGASPPHTQKNKNKGQPTYWTFLNSNT